MSKMRVPRGRAHSGFHIFSVGPYIHAYTNDASTRDQSREPVARP